MFLVQLLIIDRFQVRPRGAAHFLDRALYGGPIERIAGRAFPERIAIDERVRLSALEACEEAAGPEGPTVEAIIEAFLKPMELPHEEDDEGWRNYLALVAYVNNSPVWGRELMTRHFNPLIRRYIEALKRALPDAPKENIYWAYHYLSGSLTLTMARTGRIDILSHGLCSSEDFKTAYGRMIPFIAAGFRRICEAEG